MNNKDFYDSLIAQSRSLIEGEMNYVANTANIASLLYNELNQKIKGGNVNWAGFYFVDKEAPLPQLVLGPFMGEPACIRIKIGSGVCGTVAKNLQSLVVQDVHEFPGHIACDSRSNSELVIPLVCPSSNKLIGVLDLDSLVVGGFDAEDNECLTLIANQLASGCNWNAIL